MGLSTKIYGGVTARLTSSNDLGTLEHKLNMASLFKSMADGIGANQCDLIFDDRRTIAADTSEDLVLQGVLEDPFGSVLDFDTIKVVLIKSAATNTDDLVIGGAANAFQGWFGVDDQTLAVRPGGMVLLVAPDTGWTVTADTADELRVTNEAAADEAIYDVVIVGTSAA